MKAFAEAYPIPQGIPGPAHEDQCRYWNRKLAEQVAFTFGPAWGTKKASQTRPPSKDALARLDPDGHLHAWDILSGAGTGYPRLATKPLYNDLGQNESPQVFIAVQGADWLGAAGQPLPVPQPPSEPPTTPPTGILERLDRIEASLHDLQAVVTDVAESLPALDDAVVTRLDTLAAALQKDQVVEFKIFGSPVRGRIYPA